jgi:hypothetical protein
MSTSQPGIRTEIIPYIFYRDVPAALAWLARAFGFTEELRHAGMHAQMRCDGQRIMAVRNGYAERTKRRRRRRVSSFSSLMSMPAMNERPRLGLRSSTLRATIRSPTARAFNNELIVHGAAAKLATRPPLVRVAAT